MKRNLILLIVVLVLGGVTFYLIKNKPGTFSFSKKDTFDPRSKDFAVKDTGSVTKIFLIDAAQKSILLEKKATGHWIVNKKYRARQDAIDLLLKTMKDVSVQKMVDPKMKENLLKRMASGATKIEVYAGEEKIKQYYVGGETQDQTGTFMLLTDLESGKNFSEPYVMEIKGFKGYLTPRYFINEGEWRDRTVFSFIPPELKFIEVEHITQPDQSFRIDILNINSFTVTSTFENKKIENPDTAAIKQYLSYYKSIQFLGLETVLKPEQRDSVRKSKPVHIITVGPKNGPPIVTKLFLKRAAPGIVDDKGNPVLYDKDNMYAVINEGELVLVQYYVFGKLLQPAGYFRGDKAGIVKK